MQRDNTEGMDKQIKRYGNPNPAQQGSCANGSITRLQQGGANGNASPARASGSQPSSSSSTRQRGSNRSGASQSQARAAYQRESKTGKATGSFKGGNQPQGLGSFDELGLNGAEQGTRKHNYNHLLNFSYGHRHDQGVYHGGRRGQQMHRYYFQPRYNKENFLQATCQFIVKESGDYAVHQVDPDVLVQWSNIEMIKVFQHEPLNCPICLHTPVAAKMTRCGHVYCWGCILHYLALTDANYRKCPICYESIYAADLKSVVTEVVEPISVGSEITMRLMVRQKNAVQPYPVSEWDQHSADGKFNNLKDSTSLGFSKLLLIRPDQLAEEVLRREEHELKFALETEKDNPESCFIEAALKHLDTRRQSSLTCGTPTPIPAMVVVEPRAEPLSVVKIALKSAKKYTCAFSEEEGELSHGSFEEPCDFMVEAPLSEKDVSGYTEVAGTDEPSLNEATAVAFADSRKPDVASSPTGSTSTYSGRSRGSGEIATNVHYFYQAADGQHIYLHPINVRMLTAQYGHIRAAPWEITGKVVDVDTWTVNDEIRKRYRYLSHLPLTCVFSVVELELKPPAISEEIFASFKPEIEQRHHIRHVKMQDEMVRQQDAENAFRKNIRGRVSFSLQSELFPAFSPSPTMEDLNLASEEAFPTVGSESSGASLPSGSKVTPPTPTSSAPKSFAQMLREGKIQRQTSSGTEPAKNAPKTASSDEEGELSAVPDFQASFSAGLDAAFSQLAMEERGQQGTGKGSKKKKKTTKVTLFATGAVPRM